MRSCKAVLFLFVASLVPPLARVSAMEVQVGSGGVSLIEVGDSWRFFRGVTAPSDPSNAWAQEGFDDTGWETGPSGFGYGDGDDETILDDMEDHYLAVYLRKAFSAEGLSPDDVLELVIDWDDGFVAYLNGDEAARRNISDEAPTYQSPASSHEAGQPTVIPLGTVGEWLHEGTNLLAIEGHNTDLGSTDFSLIPALRTASNITRLGDAWVVPSPTVPLSGRTDAPGAVSVVVDGVPATFEPAEGTWQATTTVSRGYNTLVVEALDAQSQVVDSATVEILYIPPENRLAGPLEEDATWSGAVVLEETVTVPVGVELDIAPGTTVLLEAGVSLIVHGRLRAEGTAEEPVLWTRYGSGSWRQIRFASAQDSLLSHCLIEFADSEGDHKDYYDDDCDPATPPPSRDYHEAVVIIACHVDMDGCVFRHLPDDAAGGEGDAIAVISDDPDRPGTASATIRNSRFLSIGQGIHTRFSYVLVEGCYFTGHDGDNDDVDLYGESTPPPMIRGNVMLNPNHDDMINPTRCSAWIVGNLIGGCDDHGVVLRDKGAPVVMNNVIFDCRSAGIAVQNQCDALLINNTIVNCGRGVRFFDHTGRWGPPYCLNPGSGRATLVNCIIWDCDTSFELTDSPWSEDRGSHATVSYCDVQGGQSRASVSANSTLTWGEGNFDEDPLFADADSGDVHLRSTAGRWDPAGTQWVTDAVMSPCIDAGDPANAGWADEYWPHGRRLNVGAFGGTTQASLSASAAGRAADLNADDVVGLADLLGLVADWTTQAPLLRTDLNRDGRVDLADVALAAADWLRSGS